MKLNKMWGVLAGCIVFTALIPMHVKANTETQAIMNELVRASPGWDKQCTDSTIKISQHEGELLMRIASAEGANQGISGMKLIMQVIWNRVNNPDPSFPDCIEDVIFQSGQFETVSNGSFYTADISPEAHIALAEFEMNVGADNQIIGFETTANNKVLEKYFKYAYTKGDHDFYVSKSK